MWIYDSLHKIQLRNIVSDHYSKICKKCNKKKTGNDYHKNNKTKDGLLSICKSCKNIEVRDHYKENRESILFNQKKYKKPRTKEQIEKKKFQNQDYQSKNKDKLKIQDSNRRKKRTSDYENNRQDYLKNNADRLKIYSKPIEIVDTKNAIEFIKKISKK